PCVERDLALIKVKASPTKRAEVLQLCDVFRARAVDVGAEALTIEMTGAEDKVDGLLEVLRPFGILETGRRGLVVMARGAADAAIARPDGEREQETKKRGDGDGEDIL